MEEGDECTSQNDMIEIETRIYRITKEQKIQMLTL